MKKTFARGMEQQNKLESRYWLCELCVFYRPRDHSKKYGGKT